MALEDSPGASLSKRKRSIATLLSAERADDKATGIDHRNTKRITCEEELKLLQESVVFWKDALQQATRELSQMQDEQQDVLRHEDQLQQQLQHLIAQEEKLRSMENTTQTLLLKSRKQLNRLETSFRGHTTAVIACEQHDSGAASSTAPTHRVMMKTCDGQEPVAKNDDKNLREYHHQQNDISNVGTLLPIESKQGMYRNSTNTASSIKDTDDCASHAITTCHSIMTEKIDPGIVLCPFDLAGQCLDDTCQLQHIRSIKMLPNSTTEKVG
jgi:chromosome segregation ATPase